jgi:hypothetical protein
MKDLKFCCSQMAYAVDSDEVPIQYTVYIREFVIRILDGGGSGLEIRYCPWCGDKLPEGLRDLWFDTLMQRGIDPGVDDIPPEFTDQRWYSTSADQSE